MATYKTVSGFCSTTGRPVGFQLRAETDGNFSVVGSFSISAGTKSAAATDIHGKIFNGGFKCKCCGNSSFIQCDCGNLVCADADAGSVTCPNCNSEWKLKVITADEVTESTVKGMKQ